MQTYTQQHTQNAHRYKLRIVTTTYKTTNRNTKTKTHTQRKQLIQNKTKRNPTQQKQNK